MPNTQVQAAAEGLPALSPPTLTRRGLLASAPALAAVVVTPVAAVAAVQGGAVAQGGDEELFALLRDYHATAAELKAAQDNVDWIAAEYRHLWPLAPAGLLNMPDAHLYPGRQTRVMAERDIVGGYMMRDKPILPGRSWRPDGKLTCFTIDRADAIAEDLAELRSRKITGRTEKALVRNRIWLTGLIKDREHKLVLARQYEAETARLRDLAGADKAVQHLKDMKKREQNAANAVLNQPATTDAGLLAKADFYLSYPEAKDFSEGFFGACYFNFGWRLSKDIRRVRGGEVVS